SLLLHDLEQLDLEHERRARLDLRRLAAIAVRDVRRTDELRLPADLHHLHALGPALDDAVQRERRRLAALHRAVEHRTVGQCARVVHLHRVRGLRRVARPGLDLRIDQTGRGLLRALLRRRLVEVALAGLLLLFGRLRHARLRELVDLRTEGLEVDLLLVFEHAVAEPFLHELELLLRQLERAEVLAEREAERVHRLVVVGAECRFGGAPGGGRDDDEHQGGGEETHVESFPFPGRAIGDDGGSAGMAVLAARRVRGKRAAAVRGRARRPQSSYLNESFTLARYARTFPSSRCMSSCDTSATRRSRSVFDALATAAAAAFSHESVLVPTSSITLYTLSGMAPSLVEKFQ